MSNATCYMLHRISHHSLNMSLSRCCVLYLPCLLLSLSLTSLYRKTEKYPGPSLDVETQPLDSSKVRLEAGHLI